MKKILSIAVLGSFLIGMGGLVAAQAVAETEGQPNEQENKKPDPREEMRKKREEERERRQENREQLQQNKEKEKSAY